MFRQDHDTQFIGLCIVYFASRIFCWENFVQDFIFF